MINKVSSSSVNNRQPQRQPQTQPSFKGLEGGVLGFIQLCEANPMVNVAVLDVSTAIAPRTIVEGQTNPYAGFEAFRRESSGLIINCMIPGIIVLGIAKGIQPLIMGKGSNLAGSWANEETVKLITTHYKDAADVALGKDGKPLFEGEKAAEQSKNYNTLKSILDEIEGVDGKKITIFKGMDFEESLKIIAEKNSIEKPTKADKKALKNAYKAIAEKTLATENIKIGSDKYFSQNLESVINETCKVTKEMFKGNVTDIEGFAKKATKLINWKGALGLGVIIPLAIAAQPINRWLTEKSSGKKGAPIYKDFGDTQNIELSSSEKAALSRQKMISIASMIGVSMLSMMKLPNMAMLKSLSQFKGVFPSMDQARLISTATFASRMGASQDKNDLREATFRDIATFSSFYFLGDYVAKGIATAVQKFRPDMELINVLKDAPGKKANVFKKFGHWAKHTALKSSDELATKELKKVRAACQLGNIVFSLLALGIVIPKMYRGKTNEEREKELKKIGVDQVKIDKYYHHLVKNNPNFASKTNAYDAFFTSNGHLVKNNPNFAS